MILSLYHWLARGYFLLHNFILRPKLHRVRGAIFYQDKLLLVQHIGARREWTLPGGGINQGESSDVAMRREIKEELDIELCNVRYIGTETMKRRHAQITNELFRAETQTPEFRPRRLELRKVRWFASNDLPQAVSPVTKRVIEVTKN